MKTETPAEFEVWLNKYKETANYFMAVRLDDKDQIHAIWLCMRDAFIKGAESKPHTGAGNE